MKMKDTIRKTTLRLCMFLAVCFTFLIFGNVKSVSVADASAILYKNGTKVQSPMPQWMKHLMQ